MGRPRASWRPHIVHATGFAEHLPQAARPACRVHGPFQQGEAGGVHDSRMEGAATALACRQRAQIGARIRGRPHIPGQLSRPAPCQNAPVATWSSTMTGVPVSMVLLTLFLALNGCSRSAPARPDPASGTQDPLGSHAQGKTVVGQEAPRPGMARTGPGEGSYGSSYGVRAQYQACMTDQPRGAGTAGHRQDCAETESGFQHARLARIYRHALDVLAGDGDGAASSRLLDAQSQWLSGMEEACGEIAEEAGSTMGPAAQSTCIMEMTARRAYELESHYLAGRK